MSGFLFPLKRNIKPKAGFCKGILQLTLCVHTNLFIFYLKLVKQWYRIGPERLAYIL